MKISIVCLPKVAVLVAGIALTAASVYGQASSGDSLTWRLQSQLESGHFYSDICFVNGSNGWAVGDSGAIHHTSDGGQTWMRQASGVGSKLISVHFVDVENGWVAGSNDTVLRTADGGATWTVQMQSGRPRGAFVSVYFASRSVGWLAGNHARILYTVDGGSTWSEADSGTRWTVTALHFRDEKEGWAVATNRILLHTLDGGQTWTPTDLNHLEYGGTVTFDDIYFNDAGNAWITLNGMMNSTMGFMHQGIPFLQSTDSGQSWHCLRPPCGKAGSCCIEFADSRCGWISNANTIFATQDAGDSWTCQVEIVDDIFVDLCVLDYRHGWAITFKGAVYVLGEG